MTKHERVALANQFIEAIASRGRRFFEYVHDDDNGRQVAYLTVDHNGKIWFYDEWKMVYIYVSRPGSWKGFHHGGTLHSVIAGLVKFIKTGEPYFHGSFFDAKHWAYDQDGIDCIVNLGKVNGIIKSE